MNIFSWLENFFVQNCDGDWEHGNGIQIESLDNPGWLVRIDLVGTDLADPHFDEYQEENSEYDWMVCRKREGFFEGFGGPANLTQILETFQKWSMTVKIAQNGADLTPFTSNGFVHEDIAVDSEVVDEQQVEKDLEPAFA